jgi:hypothetical protein
VGTWAQQAREVDHRSSFLFPKQGGLPPLLGLVKFECIIYLRLAHNILGIWGWGR